MRQRVVGFATILGLACVMAACRSVTSDGRRQLLPPALPVGAAGLSGVEISQARALYVAKCAKCHGFYAPDKYSETEWGAWMKKMSARAKLKPEEQDQLSSYLGAFRLEPFDGTDPLR